MHTHTHTHKHTRIRTHAHTHTQHTHTTQILHTYIHTYTYTYTHNWRFQKYLQGVCSLCACVRVFVCTCKVGIGPSGQCYWADIRMDSSFAISLFFRPAKMCVRESARARMCVCVWCVCVVCVACVCVCFGVFMCERKDISA
jgi:hypothetical protein